MKTPNPPMPQPDPAAIFAAALSIWTACHELAKGNPSINLSATFNGIDELMRVAMNVATKFETWSCSNIDFDRLSEWWPYKLENQIGAACLDLFELEDLPAFNDEAALRIALKLKLPFKPGKAPLAPVRIEATNPLSEALFCRISIRSVREAVGGSDIESFTEQDDPYDPNYGMPFYGIYGVDHSGKSEHIADRNTLDEAIATTKKMIPGLAFQQGE